MSTRRHFGIVLLLCCLSLSYNYRLIENHEELKTCPARNRDLLFNQPHLNNQQRNFYNVHDIPARQQINSNQNEMKSENWLLRIFHIKSVSQNPSHEVPGTDENKHIDGFLKRLFNILRSNKMEEPLHKHTNNPKILFIIKKNPHTEDHRIIKPEPLQYNFM
ncbi:uncharacterized protein Sgsf [Drosophila takahashii]|uniref:uncharacterized protein Sgsf n=1 Tax=Drosophila takahashii TaxID=29030 RepID=UPI0038992862